MNKPEVDLPPGKPLYIVLHLFLNLSAEREAFLRCYTAKECAIGPISPSITSSTGIEKCIWMTAS